MKKILVLSILSLGFLTACASNPAQKESIVSSVASNLQAPYEKFSNFSEFELLPMKIDQAILADDGKKAHADVLEGKLETRLNEVFSGWENTGSNRKLTIQPELKKLRIIGGANRFFAGAFAGNSNIELKLNVVDAATGKTIGAPVVSRQADATTGAWSVGASDKNLVDYIVDISARYFENNY